MEGNDIGLVSKSNLLKVKDKLIIGIQDWFKGYVDKMVEGVFYSLFSKEDSGHPNHFISKVGKSEKAIDIGVEHQLVEMERKSE